jgi:hypothetical protein
MMGDAIGLEDHSCMPMSGKEVLHAKPVQQLEFARAVRFLDGINPRCMSLICAMVICATAGKPHRNSRGTRILRSMQCQMACHQQLWIPPILFLLCGAKLSNDPPNAPQLDVGATWVDNLDCILSR